LARTSADRPATSTSIQAVDLASDGVSWSLSVYSPGTPYQPAGRVACHRPTLSRIQIESGKYLPLPNGPWRLCSPWPHTMACSQVFPSLLYRPITARLMPSTSGRAAATAAWPSCTGAVSGFLRW
jgi:hypothetical protein